MENIKNTVSPQYKWNLNNPETVKTAQSTYIKNNRDKILVKKRLAYRKDITKSRELGIKYAKLYRMRHPEKIRERAALYRKNNKEKIAKRDKVYQSKFTKDMNWKNHGTYWEIDHIIPISWFKTRQQIITRGWRLDNLQPLEKELNASKNNQFAGNPKTSNGVIYL
jgi:5-methylcytosine-specific restriction endonuclease McrA